MEIIRVTFVGTMGNYRGKREKFQGYDIGTMCTMEVNFDDTIEYLHEPNRANSAIILRTLSGDNSEV